MKDKHDKLAKVRRTIALVKTCTISVDQAIKVAQSIGGTVFDVRLKEVDQQVVWRVKLLRNSERIKVFVHGTTGYLLEVKAKTTANDAHPGIIPETLPTQSLSN